MLRNILAVVVGYIVMSVAVMIVIFGLMMVFPAYREAGENNTPPPTLPVVLNLIASVFCAAIGGCVCYRIAKRNRNAAFALAGLVFVLGIVFAFMSYGGPQPLWYLVLLPILGAAGVVLGISCSFWWKK